MAVDTLAVQQALPHASFHQDIHVLHRVWRGTFLCPALLFRLASSTQRHGTIPVFDIVQRPRIILNLLVTPPVRGGRSR